MKVRNSKLDENPSTGTQADACGRNWPTDGWTGRLDEGSRCFSRICDRAPPPNIYIYIYIYIQGVPGGSDNFGRVFLMLKYTDITQNTYIQSWTATEIMAREKCGLLAGLRTVPCQLTAYRMSVLDCRVRLQKYRWRSYVTTPLWLTACHV